MTLKKRLLLSNIAVVMIPLIITILAVFLYIQIYSRLPGSKMNYDGIQTLAKINLDFLGFNDKTLSENPGKLLDKEFQTLLINSLAENKTDIVVLKKNDQLFSSKKLSQIDTEKLANSGSILNWGKSVKIGSSHYVAKTFDLNFKDGEPGRIILFAETDLEGTYLRNLVIFAVFAFVLSFIGVNILLSYTLSKQVVQPLNKLGRGASEIASGNLDNEFIEEGDEEIKSLYRSQEIMRIKLKDSIKTLMKYDDNRKMLLSSISHDLKTPITSIKGYVEGILDGVADTPAKNEKYLKTIYSKAVHVDKMIEDLLLYSRLDMNQLPYHFEKTDIAEFFIDCVSEMESEMERHHIQLTFENRLKQNFLIPLDRDRIKRAVLNILDNSRKYMDKTQGKIEVILRENEKNIVVEIKDNGPGIPQAALPMVFERFYRADASRGKIDGSGLGLSIAKQIVEGHKGNIWVKSTETQGTAIMMSFVKC